MKLRLSGLLLLYLLCSTAWAAEVIESFHSDITVLKDGSMEVTETITVKAAGNKIKRGIYRDFPTRYEDRLGNNYVVGFKIMSIKRDQRPEPYHAENRNNGIRIYVGQTGRNVSHGRHRYDITYRTDRQLGFFEKHDELYWNVTGHDWAFPILKASARVSLPVGVEARAIKLKAYTGHTGNTGQNYTANITSNDQAYFQATEPLGVKEGLTIVVGFPKGHVIEPSTSEKIGYLLKDNQSIFVMLLGMLVMLAYYWFVWSRVGKDPEQGVIIPHYEPPVNYSPAAVRFIREMDYDNTCFTAAVVNLAVQGHLTISDDNDEYVISKKEGGKGKPTWDERALLSKMFRAAPTLTLKQINHVRIAGIISTHESALEKNYEKIYFKLNSAYFMIGLLITAVVLLLGFVSQFSSGAGSQGKSVIFLTIWLSVWTVAVCAVLANAWRAWKRVSSAGTVMSAIGSTLFAIIFLFFEVMAAGMLLKLSSITFLLMIILIIAINWVFYELLKTPTLAGRKLLDKVAGLKQYIVIAEKNELAYKNASGKTPELFERILPYAIALEIDDIWGKQFEDVLSQSSVGKAEYSPRWYRGTHWNVNNIGGFIKTVGSSLGSAIASSSRAPGSSSGGGFSGGGSSGGGGGGGGGGGW